MSAATNGNAARLLGQQGASHYGKYRGQVADNVDAAERGRVQVSVPALLGDQLVWAMPCVPYAGNGVGLFALPPVGAGVWVEFEGGDLDYPIWTGCFWADGEISPATDAAPEVKFWNTDAVSVRIDDAAGAVAVKLVPRLADRFPARLDGAFVHGIDVGDVEMQH